MEEAEKESIKEASVEVSQEFRTLINAVDSLKQIQHHMEDEMDPRSAADQSSRSGATDPRVDSILVALAQVVKLLERQVQQHQTQDLIELFLKLAPSKFDGLGESEEAEIWIMEMEKIFSLLKCNDADKVILAEYQLYGNAEYWWQAMKTVVFPEGAEIVWKTFVDAFFEKYFSNYARDKKITEFLQLKQEDMSVAEYDDRFCELSRFAPWLVEHSEDKAKKFLKGLRPEIRKQLVPFGPMTYGEIYNRAQLVEEMIGEEAEPKVQEPQRDVSRGKRPMQFGKGAFGPNKRRFGMNFSRAGAQLTMDRRPTQGEACRRCGAHHETYPCPSLKKCFRCGKIGHIVRNCPQGGWPNLATSSQASKGVIQRRGQGQQRPPTQGRAYALTQEEA